MLADLVDHVIGVDPDRDRITVAIIHAHNHAELAAAEFPANGNGYRQAIDWADEHSNAERRVWSIEGCGSFGAGLCATLQHEGEWVLEFSRPRSRPSVDGAKTDRLDAARAGREILGRTTLAQPRANGTREALRALLVTRDGAQRARTAAINELRALLLSAPDELRSQLRRLTRGKLIDRCSRLRPATSSSTELAGIKRALRSLAERVIHLSEEVAELETAIRPLIDELAPGLQDLPGVGLVSAAQIVVSWSHPGRCRNEAAFARLAGVAPIPASSGQRQHRHRLSRGGDRQLNRAIHTIAITRARIDPATKLYLERRVGDGKTLKEARRCLKRYITRQIFRHLEHPPLDTR